MSRFNKYWRPELFSALGAGFKDDGTLEDGIHLRWILNSLMGLPFQYAKTGQLNQTSVGGFQVYYNTTADRSINRVNLFTNETYPSYSILQNTFDSQLRPVDGKFQFFRNYREEFLKPYWQLAYYTDMLRSRFNLIPDSYGGKKMLIDFVEYMEEVLEKLKPGEMFGNFAYSEVCAVDIAIQKKKPNTTGAAANNTVADQWHRIMFPNQGVSRPTVPTIPTIPDINIGFPGTILNQSKPKIWYRMKGYDRHGRLVAEDWLGQYGQSPFTIPGRPQKNTYKLYGRLRAAGIYSVEFETVSPPTDYVLQDFQWMFCEDYCQHEKVWSPVRNGGEVYKAFPDYYTPESVKGKLYRPFRKNVDYDEATELIRKHIVQDSETNAMLSTYMSFGMYRHRTKYSGDDGNSVELPTLGALLSASVEPLMANVLGLYQYLDLNESLYKHLDGRDFKVEGHLPFFQSYNLKLLEGYFAQFIYGNSKTDIITWDEGRFMGAQLCGLVLEATVSKKPQPVSPEKFTTKVHVTDFPSPDVPDGANLMIQSKLGIPYNYKDNIDIIKPYLHPVAYELLRRLSLGPIENVMEAEETDPGPMDKLGILPPVYFPRSQDIEDKEIRLRDSFIIPAIKEELLRYYLRAFDIFGRPSELVEGEEQTIELPCYPPTAPTGVKAEIRRQGAQVHLNLQFSVDTDKPLLQALWQNLEIEIHDLPDSGDDPPAALQWAGNKTARKLTFQYDAVTRELIPASLAQSCVRLHWAGDELQRTALNNASCAALFPPATPVVNIINPANMSFEETGFRTFTVRMPIGLVSQLGAGVHRWNIRLRVKGECADSGATKYSEEVCVSERLLITPPPPPVQQPPIVRIPVSTYADTQGDAYYMLDLEDFLSPADLAAEPRVNIYQATLDRLPDGLDLVSGPDLLNQAQFITLAKTTKTRFELQTPEPVKVNAANRFFPVKVPGDLQQYHVVGVLGTNQYLEEKSWSEAGVFLFRTPEPLPDPVLNFMRADTAVRSGQNTVALRYSALFTGTLPDVAHPPRLQIMRRDLSRLDQPPAVFVTTVSGSLGASDADSATYQFDFTDYGMNDWRRYRYEVYLLRYDDARSQYIKTRQHLQHEVLSDWSRTAEPLLPADAHSITNKPAGNFVQVDFAPGEFKFSLVKVLPDGGRVRYEGFIKNGAIYGRDADKCTLAPTLSNSKYRLTILDDEPTAGEYTFRLSFGLFNWSKKLTTP